MNRHFSVPYLVHPEVMLFKLCEQNIWFYPLTYMLIPVLLVQCISYISSFSKFRSTILRLLSSVRIVIDITGTSVENWQGNQLSVTQLDPLTCSWGHSSTFFFVHLNVLWTIVTFFIAITTAGATEEAFEEGKLLSGKKSGVVAMCHPRLYWFPLMSMTVIILMMMMNNLTEDGIGATQC